MSASFAPSSNDTDYKSRLDFVFDKILTPVRDKILFIKKLVVSQIFCTFIGDLQQVTNIFDYPLLMTWGGGIFTLHLISLRNLNKIIMNV